MNCPDCGSDRIAASAVKGLVRCDHCGKVFPGTPPEPERPDLEELDPDFKVPDIAGWVPGWRAWGVPASGDVPILHSVTFSDLVWTPREVVEASCQRGKKGGHQPPEEACSCGLYAAKDLDHLMSMNYHRYDAEARGMFHVIGRVRLWGKVIEGTQGWRAQYGYPDHLYVPFEAWHLMEPLKETYGVEVSLKNFLGYSYERSR